jgi:cell division protein ZapE
MGPAEKYQDILTNYGFSEDAAQQHVVAALQQLHDQLARGHDHGGNQLTAFMSRLLRRKTTPVRGLYIWGGVGRGKTWLMNLFHETLPFDDKLRLHFHNFMLDVHARLSQLQKQKNPLKQIARDFANRYRVLCLDEFIVTNITDAMLLYGLLDELFNNGVIVVATSNRAPDELYKNGLQRERFLPAIALLKQHTRVMQIDGNTDHRLALLEKADTYYTPISPDIDTRLFERFKSLSSSRIEHDRVLSINDRPVRTRVCGNEIAWFDFDALCEAPRAAPDYIVLARDFHTLILSGVPVMDESREDSARRFIYLIDALYDRNVKLIISAAAVPEQLYCGRILAFPYRRTSSRLIEMRSEAYLEKPHRGGA